MKPKVWTDYLTPEDEIAYHIWLEEVNAKLPDPEEGDF